MLLAVARGVPSAWKALPPPALPLSRTGVACWALEASVPAGSSSPPEAHACHGGWLRLELRPSPERAGRGGRGRDSGGTRQRPGGPGRLGRDRGLQMAGRCAFGPSVLTVNRELVRKVRGQGRLVVHGSMERDVGLLRLYPGIPATLVGTPAQPPRCLPPVPPPLPTFVSLGPAPPPLPSQPVHLICDLGLSPGTSQHRVPRAPLRLRECGPGLCSFLWPLWWSLPSTPWPPAVPGADTAPASVLPSESGPDAGLPVGWRGLG